MNEFTKNTNMSRVDDSQKSRAKKGESLMPNKDAPSMTFSIQGFQVKLALTQPDDKTFLHLIRNLPYAQPTRLEDYHGFKIVCRLKCYSNTGRNVKWRPSQKVVNL